jgi:hypothetical protein
MLADFSGTSRRIYPYGYVNVVICLYLMHLAHPETSRGDIFIRKENLNLEIHYQLRGIYHISTFFYIFIINRFESERCQVLESLLTRFKFPLK